MSVAIITKRADGLFEVYWSDGGRGVYSSKLSANRAVERVKARERKARAISQRVCDAYGGKPVFDCSERGAQFEAAMARGEVLVAEGLLPLPTPAELAFARDNRRRRELHTRSEPKRTRSVAAAKTSWLARRPPITALTQEHRLSDVEAAYHEAAHCVVALALGYPPVSADIFMTGERGGSVVEAKRITSPRDRITVFSAGRFGQLGYRSRSWLSSHSCEHPLDLKTWCAEDDEDIRRTLATSSGYSKPSLAECREQARLILARNWSAVQRIADALVERGELRGDEISTIAAVKPQGGTKR